MPTYLETLKKRFELTNPSDRELWFMGLAEYAAKRSRDLNTKVGAVIAGPDFVVRSLGWNGYPRSVDDSVELRRVAPLKYVWTEHAERNAIYNAARNGVSTVGCMMFGQTFPCADCARGIIQSGISTYYTYFPDWDPEDVPLDDWRRQTPEVIKMLKEAKVDLRLIARPPIELMHNTVTPQA